MYDFKRYSFPEERKKNSFIYGFFSLLFILVIVIFTLIADKPRNNTKIASSNLSSVENKLIVDGIKMEDDTPPVETEGEVIFDDNFDDDIDLSNKIVVDSSKSKKK